MLKPVSGTAKEKEPPRRCRRLKMISTLPTLLTLSSACFGFAALYCCALELHDLGAGQDAARVITLEREFLEYKASTYLAIAAWIVLAGMICDALDGRVARMTNSVSRFGEQLDSLTDLLTFGAAPALMVVTLVRRELAGLEAMPLGYDRWPQMTWLMATVYVCCTAIRLARFQVEANAEETAHTGFRGLPSLAAAAAIVSLVYFHDQYKMRHEIAWLTHGIAVAVPFLTLIIGLLMVSRIPYRPLISKLLRQRPFQHVIPLMLAIPCIYLFTEEVAVIFAWSFVLSGLVRFIIAKLSGTYTDSHHSNSTMPTTSPNPPTRSYRHNEIRYLFHDRGGTQATTSR